MASYNNDLNQDDQSRSDWDNEQPGAPELTKNMTWSLYEQLGVFMQAIQKRHDDTEDEDECSIMKDVLIKAQCLYDEIGPLM
jgi:hypothetical protein